MFAFEFTSIDYDRDKEPHYTYLLKGFNENWINLGLDRKITFTGLLPGDYQLRIKTANTTGKMGKEEASLDLMILPPWWRTGWARAVYIVLIFSGLYGFIQWRSRTQKKKLKLQKEELAKERKLNDRLKQIDRLKDQFLANTSHELKTPLVGIIGLAESLLEGVAGDLPDKAQQDLSLITLSGKRLSHLINDILDISKLKNEHLQLNIKPVDIFSVTNVVFSLSKPLLKGKSLQLVNEIPPDVPLIEADEDRLEQILNNLIGNAIKFTQEGSVCIYTDIIESDLAISVKDTGIGIPKDKFEDIFNSFRQLDSSATRNYEGTGLGLSITKQLVELHGGMIFVESEPGKGSTFTFRMRISKLKKEIPTASITREVKISPIEGPKYSHPSDSVVIDKPDSTKRGVKVLVVDDDPVNLRVLQNQLQMTGYEVIPVSSGMEALELLEKGDSFDMMILDIMMPGMSGFEVCQKLREKFLPSELPVVMLTAKNLVDDLVEGFNLGANDYITKPFSKNELISRVKTHLNLHRINQATGKFVPYEFLRSIGRDTITEVELGDHVKKEVTVLFSDIRDYTTLSEKMSPEENFRFVNAFVGRMGPIIHDHHGFVNQYLGDAIMAIFPVKIDDSLKAAINMLIECRNYNQQRLKDGWLPLTIGIGLHSGPLIMGIIGDSKRNDPATISDTVNIASRMEGLTKLYGANLIISEAVYDHLSEPVKQNIRYLGKVQVKGKEKAIGAYECFAGDPADTINLKLKHVDLWNNGLENFLKKEFAEAAAIFDRIIKFNPQDQPARYFKTQAAKYTLQGVPQNWTGVEKPDSK
jgi:signal transduction histidine kinase/class 3 adenylate cyclase